MEVFAGLVRSMMIERGFTPETYATFVLALPTILAFSKPIRQMIGRRDRWTCQHPGCDRQWKDGWMVHAAHWNHDRRKPGYDTPDEGRILCVPHHLAHHQDYVGRAHEIGLTESCNDWAIDMLEHTPWMREQSKRSIKPPQHISLRKLTEDINKDLFG